MCGAFFFSHLFFNIDSPLPCTPLQQRPMPGWGVNINDILCTVLLSWFLLFYCSVLQSIFLGYYSHRTVKENKEGPSRSPQASVGELHVGTFLCKNWLSRETRKCRTRLCLRVLGLPGATHLHIYAEFAGKCPHTHTHAHIHTQPLHMYVCTHKYLPRVLTHRFGYVGQLSAAARAPR